MVIWSWGNCSVIFFCGIHPPICFNDACIVCPPKKVHEQVGLPIYREAHEARPLKSNKSDNKIIAAASHKQINRISNREAILEQRDFTNNRQIMLNAIELQVLWLQWLVVTFPVWSLLWALARLQFVRLCSLFVSLISFFLVLGARSLFRSPFLCSLLASLSSFPFLSLGRGCKICFLDRFLAKFFYIIDWRNL